MPLKFIPVSMKTVSGDGDSKTLPVQNGCGEHAGANGANPVRVVKVASPEKLQTTVTPTRPANVTSAPTPATTCPNPVTISSLLQSNCNGSVLPAKRSMVPPAPHQHHIAAKVATTPTIMQPAISRHTWESVGQYQNSIIAAVSHVEEVEERNLQQILSKVYAVSKSTEAKKTSTSGKSSSRAKAKAAAGKSAVCKDVVKEEPKIEPSLGSVMGKESIQSNGGSTPISNDPLLSHVTEEELESMPIKQLNRLLDGLDPATRKQVKTKRRAIKNRGYSVVIKENKEEEREELVERQKQIVASIKKAQKETKRLEATLESQLKQTNKMEELARKVGAGEDAGHIRQHFSGRLRQLNEDLAQHKFPVKEESMSTSSTDGNGEQQQAVGNDYGQTEGILSYSLRRSDRSTKSVFRR